VRLVARPWRGALWLALAAGLLPAGRAGAWSHTGHFLIAEIAWQQLAGSPEVRRTWAELAGDLHGKYQPYSAITAAGWFDDVRNQSTAPLHFLDVPYSPGAASYAAPSATAAGAVSALRQAIARLKTASGAARVDALGRVLHLVGDLHQPLHCCDHDDRGGNQVLLAGVPHAANLHALWDQAYRYDEEGGRIVERFGELSGPIAPDDPELARLAKEAAVPDRSVEDTPASETLDPAVWHKESWTLACRRAYDPLAGQNLAAPVHVPEGYVHVAHVTADRQLQRAGARLALVLAEALRPVPPPSLPPAVPNRWLAAAVVVALALMVALLARRRRRRRR
jgi:hypothetical protein